MDEFMGFMAAAPWPLLTWSGLGLLIIISVMRGWLIPKKTHDDHVLLLTNQIKDLVAEKADLKDTLSIWESVAREAQAQSKEGLEQNKTTAHVLEAIREALGKAGGDMK